ncbi:MAG: phosphatidate cytidylyltransferase [Endomicrobium sp.]|jgi:phosphatidate cytidylyltransferase|nr:phosphatidate cytidylyltransferase [Endomicrobium sp.]
MLSTRIFTALVGIPVIFACIYFGGIPFFIMMFAVSFFCGWEYFTLMRKYNPHKVLSLIMSVLFFLSLYGSSYDAKIAVSAIIMLLVLFAVEVFGKNTEKCIERIAVSFLGAFFLPLSLSFMVAIRDARYSGSDAMQYIFLIFITVWVLDTAAFAFGKMLGKHKLAEKVSPKKTVEGAVAGAVFGVLTAIACKFIFISGLSAADAAVFGVILSVVGQFSDLAESLIKRDANIKDSGNIIPGHGGFLDRFDSYIFAAPLVYCYIFFIK